MLSFVHQIFIFANFDGYESLIKICIKNQQFLLSSVSFLMSSMSLPFRILLTSCICRGSYIQSKWWQTWQGWTLHNNKIQNSLIMMEVMSREWMMEGVITWVLWGSQNGWWFAHILSILCCIQGKIMTSIVDKIIFVFWLF